MWHPSIRGDRSPGHMTVTVLFLCTGNAARSVMAAATLGELRPELRIESAGTLSVDGLPISWRTRAAFDDIGIQYPKHASKQAVRAHLHDSDVIIGLAPEHIEWVRREHPDVADRTVTLKRLVRALAPPPPAIEERLRSLHLEAVALEPWEEVVDPGGGEVPEFVAAAREIHALVQQLAVLL